MDQIATEVVFLNVHLPVGQIAKEVVFIIVHLLVDLIAQVVVILDVHLPVDPVATEPVLLNVLKVVKVTVLVIVLTLFKTQQVIAEGMV